MGAATYDLIQEQQTEVRRLGFVLTSGVLHVALAIAAIVAGTLMPPPEKPQIIEFEIASPGPAIQSGSPALELPQQEAIKESSRSSEPSAPVAEPTPVIAKSAARSAPKAAPKIKAAVAPKVLTAPSLEDSDFEDSLSAPLVAAAPKFSDDMVEDDLGKVDQEQAQQISAFKQAMDQETDAALTEHDESLSELEQETLNQDKILTAALNNQKAAHQAEQNRLNQDRLAREAQAKEAAAAAAAATALAAQKAKASQGNGRGNGSGQGAGESLGLEPGTQVRALEDLRQMPGNKKPHYSQEDRFAGRQGEVSFLAYVSRSGQPTQFKLIRSTGHRSLDLETLKSIRNWKFYPGQEGWVEIPIKWDLKGGPQEMPTTLRRKISQK